MGDRKIVRSKCKSNPPVLCPSAKIRSGAYLFGVFREGREVQFLEEAQKLDNSALAMLDQAGGDDTNLRVANTCAHVGCSRWRDNKCVIPDLVLSLSVSQDELEVISESKPTKKCAITDLCRWRKQSGPNICGRCRLLTRTSN